MAFLYLGNLYFAGCTLLENYAQCVSRGMTDVILTLAASKIEKEIGEAVARIANLMLRYLAGSLTSLCGCYLPHAIVIFICFLDV